MLIRTHQDILLAIRHILSIDLDKTAVWEVMGKPYKRNRSSAQNRLSHKWYAELGKHTGHGKEQERNYCKFTYGCPILIENDGTGEFTSFYEKLIDTYDYEQCTSAMGFIQITSLMKVKGFTDYLNMVEQYGIERGIMLSKPDEYGEAMGK